MEKDDIMFTLHGYLEDKNYIAACLYLKNEEIETEVKHEITGAVATRVIDDLSQETNREKILYLRSILVWLFKDVPGLATVYREQLRLASGSQAFMRDLFRGARSFVDAATGGTSESVGEKVEEAADNLRPDVIQEKVKDFFSQAGVDVDDGIKKAQDFFDSLAGRNRPETGNNPRDVGDSDEE
jgi:hypothetical protein